MVITPHLLIGAAIGLKIHNFWIIFIIALLAHFVADRLPHWEYSTAALINKNKKDFLIFAGKVFIDIALSCLLFFYLLWGKTAWPYALFGAFFSALPDLPLLLIYFFPKTAWLASYKNFHGNLHSKQVSGNNILGILTETAVVALAILLIQL